METNSKKVLEALPTFEDFMNLAEDIKKLYFAKMTTENSIKTVEAENFKRVMTDPQYFVGGKAVPISYYENCYKFNGLNGELLNLREQLATVQSELEMKKNQFDIYKSMHDMWKTLVYQEKGT